MYQGNNPSALRSRKEITDAFLLLLQETPLEKMSIKQIMDATMLSRQTFYQIFDSKDEIIEGYLDTIFSEFITHAKTKVIENLCDAAKVFFSFFAEHKKQLSLIVHNGKSCVVQRKCRDYLCKGSYIHYALHGVRTEIEQDYAATFVISGIVAMLEQWLRTENNISADTLADLVCRITGTE